MIDVHITNIGSREFLTIGDVHVPVDRLEFIDLRDTEQELGVTGDGNECLELDDAEVEALKLYLSNRG